MTAATSPDGGRDRPETGSDGRQPTVDVGRLREVLLDNAWLFDQPAAYAAGVQDALASVQRHIDRSRTDETDGHGP